VFNADSGQRETRPLFPADRPPATAQAPALSLRLDEYRLSRRRQYGDCWRACELWRHLGLDQFWAERRTPAREGTDWARLLQVSTAYRLLAPGSSPRERDGVISPSGPGGHISWGEGRCHRPWDDRRAMGDRLGPDFQWGGKDQLYFVLDRLLAHRPALFTHVQHRWKDLFGAPYEVLLYDRTRPVR
jgi:hypothetical protein